MGVLGDKNKARPDANPVTYMMAENFLRKLRKSWSRISYDDFVALRQRALGGDIAGAEEALARLIGAHEDDR